MPETEPALEDTLFDLFDGPRFETPDLIINRLGKHGIRNAIAENTERQQEVREKLDSLKTELASLVADSTALHEAEILARDMDLE